LLKRLSFLHCMFLVKSKVGIAMWIHILVLYSVPLVFLSIFVPVPCCFSLLRLCSIVWSWVLWYFQHCSFWSVLPWLFAVFCVS
jgi:hypothetical protein